MNITSPHRDRGRSHGETAKSFGGEAEAEDGQENGTCPMTQDSRLRPPAVSRRVQGNTK